MTMTQDRAGDASFAAARRAMIDSQLRTSGVNVPFVLAAMASLPREDFLPEAARSAAYIDRAVPLGGGRFLAAPLVHGKILAEANPTADDNALLIASGSNYLEALLRPLVGKLTVVDAGAVAGGIAGGPYSLIIVDGAAEELPESIATALADDGRVVTGIVETGVTRLAAGRKTAGGLALLALADIGIPVLPEFAAPKRWSF